MRTSSMERETDISFVSEKKEKVDARLSVETVNILCSS